MTPVARESLGTCIYINEVDSIRACLCYSPVKIIPSKSLFYIYSVINCIYG